MKQIELFGCTGAGKTTFAKNTTGNLKEAGNDLWLSDNFLLDKVKLSRIKNKHIQTLLLDSYLFVVFLLALPNYLNFFRFTLQSITQTSISIIEKINITRNIIKRIGTYEVIQRSGSDQQIVLVDGGTLQIAHHLFVHVAIPVSKHSLNQFVKQVPLPEAAIYFTEDETTLVIRTSNRGHRRIPDQSPEHTATFIKNAVEAFDELVRLLESDERMALIDTQHNILISRAYLNDIILTTILKRICSNTRT